MCGISGFHSASRAITGADLCAINQALAHRGPDAEGIYLNENETAGLAHRRLSIIDLSAAANQPMRSACGRYLIVFNGEVYNFRDIARQLNIHPRTSSDTEIILEAFAIKGMACVHLFNGMFAIAIYDTAEDAIYLFRDRLGVKPLYYFAGNGNFCFASEIKGLLQCALVRSQNALNEPAVFTFLNAGYIPGPHTIYSSIKKFPAGCVGVYKNGTLQITPYWNLPEKIRGETVSDYSAAKKQLHELLTDAVRLRMISDVPYGTFLSGGIDSSTVTAVAQRVSQQPLNTFSIGFREARYNESEYARAVAKHLGTHHHEFTVTENDALQLVETMLDAYDEPYADSSAIPTMLVSKLARRHVTMVLSGDGGDELFMGYGMYRWAERLHHPLWRALRRPVAALLRMGHNRYKRAAGLFDFDSFQTIKSHIFSQEQYFFSETELHRLLFPRYINPLLFDEQQIAAARKLSPAEHQALYDIRYYLRDDLLVKVDIASMHYSLEVRTPFLDYRIVEFAVNLSPHLKIQHGTAKYLLKEVLYDYVPRQLFQRPKWGFAIPLPKWLRHELSYLICDYLNRDIVMQCGIAKPEAVQHLLHRFDRGEDYLYNRVWALAILHRWLIKNNYPR
ncbi:MAG: asparagine synthase (glutamine-hydrolyzing) [Chitinophagales bacterium]|nr:asparagine synthase (glutamine-hydrolyzing) [Chitinophagales bacterium]MDW8419033.1 asparagine synthase (glutamine-hydrolyzing) [Chitinophagales bacterium]